MCGIAGKISLNRDVSQTELKRAAHALRHRGPDDEGIYLSEEHHVGLAHRRLSLIDLSEQGHQPMLTTDEQYSIVFNGEIYNYVEIRNELISAGVNFHSHSDTETILNGYVHWGKDILRRLKGMFAFAIYDRKKEELFLARDRFGIKPLFYSFQNGKFFFGSEIKAIKAMDDFYSQIRPASVASFLANRYITDHCTMWESVDKLPPAHHLTIDIRNLEKKIACYWSLPSVIREEKPELIFEKFEHLFSNALREHLRSDVPIGAFLSGGLDSSATVMLMQSELHYSTTAFSIGFNNWKESEDKYARMVTDFTGAELRTLLLDRIDMAVMPTLMYHYDDPIADISILPTYAVSGLASQSVKAVISGEGADELLGGYWWQKPENFNPGGNLLRKWLSRFRDINKEDIKRHYITAMSMGLFSSAELRKALAGAFRAAVPDDVFSHLDSLMHPELSTIKQIQYLDIHRFMADLVLTKVDRASMAHSLEVRVPFLDHEMVEWLFSLPEPAYMQQSVQKPLLQKLLKDKVPQEILHRPKQGFVGPDKFYMDFELYKSTLSKGALIQHEVIQPRYLQQLLLLRDHWRLWKLFVLEHWWRVWC